MDGSLRFTPPASPGAGLKSLRQLARERTRTKILAAAKILFTRHAYATVTIRMLANEIQMSTGAIFANFADKADVWRAAMECEPPLDGPIVRAAHEMQHARRGLIAVRPSNWREDLDPDCRAAWSAAETALRLSQGGSA